VAKLQGITCYLVSLQLRRLRGCQQLGFSFGLRLQLVKRHLSFIQTSRVLNLLHFELGSLDVSYGALLRLFGWRDLSPCARLGAVQQQLPCGNLQTVWYVLNPSTSVMCSPAAMHEHVDKASKRLVGLHDTNRAVRGAYRKLRAVAFHKHTSVIPTDAIAQSSTFATTCAR